MTPRLQQTFKTLIFIASLALVATADAELHDRGGGLIYDDVLDVTWLQDAAWHVNTHAPNVDANGKMTWQDAMNWVETLVYQDSVRNVDWDDWRLPEILPVNGAALDLNYSCEGLTDNGYGITSAASELSYMYHINLGGISLVSLINTQCTAQQGAGIADPAPFTGISGGVWTQTNHPTDANQAFIVGMGNGHQNWFTKDTVHFVWAVRDGDVAIAPDGDLNNDGLINVGDLLISFRILQGRITATTEQQLHGDIAPLVNGSPAPDGIITLGDIMVLERKILGMVSFP